MAAGSTAFTTSALQNSETVGSVTISASGGGAGRRLRRPVHAHAERGHGGTFTASNYSISYVAGTLTVNPASLTATVTASNKTYNGTAAAAITLCSLTGVLAADNGLVTCSASSAAFPDKNVGTGRLVTANVSLSGTKAGNYTLASTTPTTTANITARSLTVSATASSKVYDGTTTAAATLGDNRVAGDVLSITYSGAVFASRNVGSWTVSVTGISVGGTDSGNYTANTTASTTASITQRAITVTAIGVSKLYDGNTTSPQAPSVSPSLGTGDSASFTETYATAAAGGGKTMTASGSVNDSNSGANYSVTFVAATDGVIRSKLTASARNTQATAVWTAYAGATSYTVELLDTSTNTSTSTVVTTTSFLFTGLTNGQTYSITVTPNNGPSTNSVSVIPKSL